MRRGIGVAEALDGRCTACNMTLRPQFLQELKRDDQVMACESCNRILYYNPPVAVEDLANETAPAAQSIGGQRRWPPARSGLVLAAPVVAHPRHVFGNDVAAELREIVHVVDPHLRAYEETARNIDLESRPEVYVKVVRTPVV